MKSEAFKMLDFLLMDREVSQIKGRYVTAKEDVANTYSGVHSRNVVKAGTVVRVDFGFDGGFYGFADVDGTIVRVRVELGDVRKFDWSAHQEDIDRLCG